MTVKMLMASCLASATLALVSPVAYAQSDAATGDEPKVGEWFQKPFLRTEQLPPGFYYLFKSGEMLPTYYIKIPTEAEKKRGEVPYIENRSQARKIDAQYKADSYEPHLSFKTLTPEEEKKAAAAAAVSSSGTEAEVPPETATKPATPAAHPDPGRVRSPFKKNSYWSTFKALPKSANQTLFGPTVKPNTKPFKFDENKPLTHTTSQEESKGAPEEKKMDAPDQEVPEESTTVDPPPAEQPPEEKKPAQKQSKEKWIYGR